ncbi:MAG TPA: hypothetical protein PLT92_01920 [Ignavibacteriaceae bacterium]|jgi:hypothetical protein|nr:hypothetical protein [Ignavibacteriaceae bacterium]HOJ17302.1 hypothetical protein [Ignavibacteriaceae bacterium]
MRNIFKIKSNALNKNLFSLSIALLFLNYPLFSQPEFSTVNSAVGAFSRMGFGARGIAMGNSVSAVKQGNLVSYYNPALSVFQEDNSFNATYSFLSLDRSLNFINFTRRFDFYSVKDSANENQKPRSTAGLSLGLINAGVSDIDARDNQGFKRDPLSTSENQFFIGVAIKFSEKIAAGLNAKFYYYKLYEDVTTTSFGIDLGMVYTLNKNLSFSFVMTDLNSKYKFNSSSVYSTEGIETENKFPLTKRVGASYIFDNIPLILASEFVFDNYGSKIIRFGGEYEIYDVLKLRAGLDNLHLNNFDQPVRPSFGFSFMKVFKPLKISFDYAFALEPYTAMDRHIIGLNFIF